MKVRLAVRARLARGRGGEPDHWAIRRGPLWAALALAAAVAAASAGVGLLLHPWRSATGGSASPDATMPVSSSPGMPSPREGAAMAYDPATRTVVLFGGDDGEDALGDTWSWGGSGWARLDPAVSPPPRTGALMAYDPATRRLVLTGGRAMSGGGAAGSVDVDTWTWDGLAWSPEPSGSLPASASSGMGVALATDGATEQLVLVTGLEQAGCQAEETWLWSGTSWSQLHPTISPIGAEGGLLADDPVTGHLDLFSSAGGCPGDGEQGTVLWSWDGRTWKADGSSAGAAGLNVPKMIVSGQLVASAIGPLLVVYGGTYAWHGDAGWAQLTGAPGGLGEMAEPPATDQRDGEALAFDSALHEAVLFGGECASCDPDGVDYLGDTWTFDGSWALAAAGTAITPTPTSAPTPTPAPVPCAPPTPPGAPVLIGDLSMLSPTTGWAEEGGTSTILRTTSGAQRWAVASPPLSGDQQVLAASFLDSTAAQAITGTLWNCDDQGPPSATLVAWGTADGGATWSSEGAFSVASFDGGTLDFVNAEDGWLSVSEGGWAGGSAMALYRTVDAGASWEKVASSDVDGGASPGAAGVIPVAGYVGTASFINPSTGWITETSGGGDGALFYVSHNGGVTWAAQTLRAAAGLLQPSTTAPRFWSSQGGWVLVDASDQASLVYLTTDGGQEWSLVALPGGGQLPEAVDFIDAADGWLLAFTETSTGAETSQTLWETKDGGTSWTAISSDTALATPDFVNAGDGWATTTAGSGATVPALLQTTDGGRTWTAVNLEIGGSPASS